MRETIILAPGCNGTELVRSLAKRNVNKIGMRIMSAVELSTTALFSSGVNIGCEFLPRKEEPALYASFMKEIPYFSSASYSDAENLSTSIYTLRSLIAENEKEEITTKLPEGEFEEKNRAIVDVYVKFLDEIKKLGLIDSISLIRKAIEEAKIKDADFYEIKEYPLSVLEKELLKKISGDKYKTISLIDLFAGNKNSHKDPVLTKAYGASNEVEDILGYIYENNIPIDRCVIATVDSNRYSQLFYDYSQQYGINLTLGSGVPIINSNPARLLRVYTNWIANEFYGIRDLQNIIFSEAFDRKKLQDALGISSKSELDDVIKIAGNLRISKDKTDNERKITRLDEVFTKQLSDSSVAERDKRRISRKREYLVAVKKLANELEREHGDFIKTYSYIRQEHAGRIDTSALNVITEAIGTYFKYSDDGTLNEVTDIIFRKSVCSENSREGCLYVTSLVGAMASMRENLFIAGLSADAFPGSPIENYLLLDSDYMLFADKPVAPTSDQLIKNKIIAYKSLRNLADALGVSVRLSYASYDLTELKDKNPSSVISENVSRTVGFFEQNISLSRRAGQAYIEGKKIAFTETEKEEVPVSIKTDKEYSPSSIEVFMGCPRKYMLTRIMGLEEPEEEDPFLVIDAKQTGSLAHSMMEYLADGGIKKAEFEKRAEACFDEFLVEYIPLHEDVAAKEKVLFKKMISSAFDSDPGNRVELTEKRIRAEHDESGIALAGYPDRVEIDTNGSCIIADFKTGRKISHIENDIDTCIQVMIYAYIMEKNGYNIKSGEYRYLRKQEIVQCKYDPDMKDKLSEKLIQFKEALTNADFPCTDDEDNCKYCKLSGLCGKYEEETNDEEFTG